MLRSYVGHFELFVLRGHLMYVSLGTSASHIFYLIQSGLKLISWNGMFACNTWPLLGLLTNLGIQAAYSNTLGVNSSPNNRPTKASIRQNSRMSRKVYYPFVCLSINRSLQLVLKVSHERPSSDKTGILLQLNCSAMSRCMSGLKCMIFCHCIFPLLLFCIFPEFGFTVGGSWDKALACGYFHTFSCLWAHFLTLGKLWFDIYNAFPACRSFSSIFTFLRRHEGLLIIELQTF